MWKSPTRRLKRCSWGRERNLEKNTKLKPWGNHFNLKAKEAIQSIKRIGEWHRNAKRNASKISETGTRVGAHWCWLDAEASWLTAAGAVSAIATGGEREGGCRAWMQSPDGWGQQGKEESSSLPLLLPRNTKETELHGGWSIKLPTTGEKLLFL